MPNWRNESGRPLSSSSWLEAHHRAKLPERTAFVKKILERNPRRIVDLGCGPGIWLELINAHAPQNCELIGVDVDRNALQLARDRSKYWSRPTAFHAFDFESNPDSLPEADVFLAFNICPYLRDVEKFIDALRRRLQKDGLVVVRQYDGGLLRFGPMEQVHRQLVDTALQAAMLGSDQFRHYDLDRVFEMLSTSTFQKKIIDFELFKRVSPYSADFLSYLNNSIRWIMDYVSLDAQEKLAAWSGQYLQEKANLLSYVAEVELVAWMS